MPPAAVTGDIRVRRAELGDVPILAHQRVGMFRDMGELAEPLEHDLKEASGSFFRSALASGEYVAWLAATSAAPERVIAGVGLWLRPMIPRPRADGVVQGLEALIVNVYTEPNWRRRGLASLLMRHALDYTREHQIRRVLLHASKDGRPLYESLGFIPTTEMRLAEQPR